MALDSEGNHVWNRQLDIYGRVKREFRASSLGEDVRPFIPFRYQGQYFDFETGLCYNRFRYYSPETGAYISQDPIGLAGGNPTLYGYVKDSNWWVDVFGLDCVTSAKKKIDNQLEQGKNAIVVVNNKKQAEELLRFITSGPDHKGGYMDTTKENTFSPIKSASDWLPRASSRKKGTYHWDEYNPNAKVGDHASEGSHLQIHTFEGQVIRIFYEDT